MSEKETDWLEELLGGDKPKPAPVDKPESPDLQPALTQLGVTRCPICKQRVAVWHTFGSRSAMAGVDLATLKELMGHSQISMTMRCIHPTPEHKQEAARKLERFNLEHEFAVYEGRGESPQKSPQ